MIPATTDRVPEPRVLVERRRGDPRRNPGLRQSAGSPGQRLHERDAALAEIRGVLSGTFDHSWVPIVIEGRTGTGTTALLNASLEMGRQLGLRVGRARCDASESSAPFTLVRQVFWSMLHQLAVPDQPTHDGTDLARRVLRGGFAETDDPVEVYQSLMVLLEVTGDGPTLIGVDDVHWADAMSAGWLRFLAHRLREASVHLVVTTRPRRAGVACHADALVLDPASRRLILHPLSVEATTAMLGEHLGTDIGPSIGVVAHSRDRWKSVADRPIAQRRRRSRNPVVRAHRAATRHTGITRRRTHGVVAGFDACRRRPRTLGDNGNPGPCRPVGCGRGGRSRS